jgi:outer membrane protein
MHCLAGRWAAMVAIAVFLGAVSNGARAADRSVTSAVVTAVTDSEPAPPSLPQTAEAKDVYTNDYLIIAAGVALLPSYEGSEAHHIVPAFGVAGRVHGIGISPRSLGFALNLVPPSRKRRIGFSLGPVVSYRGSRTVEFLDPAAVRVGSAKGYLELGIHTGISLNHVLSHYDSISLGTDVRWDASGGTGSMVIAPGFNYLTPISRAQVVGISASASIINQNYATRTYSANPIGSAMAIPRPGNPDDGLRSLGIRAFTAYDLDGNLRNGGLSVLFGLGYSRLLGAAAQSPLVKNNGTHDQILFATGLAYVF